MFELFGVGHLRRVSSKVGTVEALLRRRHEGDLDSDDRLPLVSDTVVHGIVAFGWAAIVSSPTSLVWLILSVAVAFSVLFAVGAVDVVLRYRRLGE